MRDPNSIPIVAQLHPKIRKDVQEFIEECEQVFNITIRIVQGLRTFAEQDGLYNIGRTVKGANIDPKHPMGDIVTNSPGGSSYHNYGLAVDIVPLDGKKMDWNFNFMRLVNIGSQWNITWGGNFPGSFKDYDHFENKLGYNWKDLLKKHQAKDFISGTEYVNI